jgi:hypothetical protein
MIGRYVSRRGVAQVFCLFTQLSFHLLLVLLMLPPLLLMWVSKNYVPRLFQGGLFGSLF